MPAVGVGPWTKGCMCLGASNWIGKSGVSKIVIPGVGPGSETHVVASGVSVDVQVCEH